MNLYDLLADPAGQAPAVGRQPGAYLAVVTNNKDPEKLGRVKLKFPCWGDDHESPWARIATPMAGKEFGLFCLPEVNDEVLVVFANGDPRFPFVLGALWNGAKKPPEVNADGKNHKRVLKSRSGQALAFDDEPGHEALALRTKNGLAVELRDVQGQETIEIRAKGGQVVRLSDVDKIRKIEIGDADSGNLVEINLTKGRVTVAAGKDLRLLAHNGTVSIQGCNVSIESLAKMEIQAGSQLDIVAAGAVKLQGATVDIN
jgi:uncharacterized protein involved in type VI secretion and phage assembly